jgi:hypothetical protein
MQTYIMNVYDSRNTCVPYSIEAKNETSAHNKARILSCKNKYPVTIHNGGDWAKYEGGKCEEASAVKFLD